MSYLEPSFSIPASLVHEAPRSFRLATNAAERAALAERFHLVEVKTYEVAGEVAPAANGEFVLTARIEARVVQTCVVSLDPVENTIDERVTVRYVPASRISSPAREIHIEADENEEIEPLTGDVIDIGAVLVEQFGVALDPYPRKPRADMPLGRSEGPSARNSGDAARKNPFAVLKTMKD